MIWAKIQTWFEGDDQVQVDRKHTKRFTSVRLRRQQANTFVTLIREAAGMDKTFGPLLAIVERVGSASGRNVSYMDRLLARATDLTASIRKDIKLAKKSMKMSAAGVNTARATAIARMQAWLTETWEVIDAIVELLDRTSNDVHVIRTAPMARRSRSAEQLAELLQDYATLEARAANLVGDIDAPVVDSDEEAAAREELERVLASTRPRQRA